MKGTQLLRQPIGVGMTVSLINIPGTLAPEQLVCGVRVWTRPNGRRDQFRGQGDRRTSSPADRPWADVIGLYALGHHLLPL
jgi:hypothetical protein